MFTTICNDIKIMKHAISNNKINGSDIISSIKECIINKFTRDAKGLLSQQILTPEQISKLAIKLLAIHDPEQELKKPELGLYHELEIFASNDKTNDAPNTYFNRICRCSSVSGKEYFKSILMNYTDNLEILHRRQSNLLYFKNLTIEKREYLLSAIQQFSNNESFIYWNISDKSPEMQQVLDMLFFTKSWTKFLNYKPEFMGIYYYLIMIISPIWGIISPFVFFFVPYLFARYIIKIPIPFDYYMKQMQDMLFGKQFFAMISVAQKVFTAFYMGPNNTATLKTKLIDKLFMLLQTDLARWLYLLVIFASYIYGIYNYFVSSMNYNKLLNFIHERINHIRRLLDTAIICLSILEPQTNNCTELSNISTNCYALLNENEIILYLRGHNIFTSEPGFISNKGHIIKAYYMLEQIDRMELLGPFIKLFAWIDTWMHTATLLSMKQTHSKNTMCIVDWNITNDKPSLNIIDCWSPVGGNVTNSLLLEENTQITDTGTQLTDTGTQSTDTGITSTDTGITSTDTGITSTDTGITSTDTGTQSTDTGITSTDTGITSTDTGTPNDEKKLPESVSNVPESVSNVPESVSNVPESVSNVPESVSNVPESVSNVPESVSNVPGIVSKEYNRNCLLTGPNGSGKSTFLKAVMSAVIMAQTFGICPASSCKITPFKYLSTYLNIPDCQGRESLFQAEMRRCHEHLNKLHELNTKHEFSFNIMDEIFVSTNYLEGISGAYGVIKSLEQYPDSINIITTHFDKLTTMDLPYFCYKYFTIDTVTVDYYAGTDKNEELNKTQIQKDYKLRVGINDKHMALQLLKLRGFDDMLIKNANAMYTQLTNPH